MLNDSKLRIMTKLAVYEQEDGKEDIKMGKYYKTDYVRLQVLKTIISVTVGYVLILVMIGMYKLEYIINKVVTFDFVRIGQYILGFYIMILAVYVTGAIIGYSIKYDRSKKNLAKYYKTLKKLSSIYQDEKVNG